MSDDKIERLNISSPEDHVREIKKIITSGSVNDDLISRLNNIILKSKLVIIYQYVSRFIEVSHPEASKEQFMYKSGDRYFEDTKASVDGVCIVFGQILKQLDIAYKIKLVKPTGSEQFQHCYIIVPTGSGNDLTKRENYFAMDLLAEGFDKEVELTEEKIM